MFGDVISGAIEKFFSNLVESVIGMFLELMNGMNAVTIAVLDIPVVNQAILYSQALAASILAVKFGFEVWYNNILRNSGDSEADVQGVITRLVQTAVMISAIPWLTKEIYAWGTAIATDITNLPGTDQNSGAIMLKNLVNIILTGSSGGAVVVVSAVIVFAVVIFLIVLVQTFIRGAELAVVAVVGSFMALGLSNTNSQAFQGWWRELLNISFAQAIQILLLKCAFFSLTISINPNVPLMNVMVFAGFIWVTYKSPSILKQYIYSTGVSRGAGQAVQQVGSMVMMRKLMTGGKG